MRLMNIIHTFDFSLVKNTFKWLQSALLCGLQNEMNELIDEWVGWQDCYIVNARHVLAILWHILVTTWTCISPNTAELSCRIPWQAIPRALRFDWHKLSMSDERCVLVSFYPIGESTYNCVENRFVGHVAHSHSDQRHRVSTRSMRHGQVLSATSHVIILSNATLRRQGVISAAFVGACRLSWVRKLLAKLVSY